MAISVSEMSPTNQTDTILEGLRVLVPLRVTEETLNSLTVYELVHLFNMYIAELHQEQRDAVIRYRNAFTLSESECKKYFCLCLFYLFTWNCSFFPVSHTQALLTFSKVKCEYESLLKMGSLEIQCVVIHETDTREKYHVKYIDAAFDIPHGFETHSAF